MSSIRINRQMTTLLRSLIQSVIEFWEFYLSISIALAAILITLLSITGVNRTDVLVNAILLSLATITASMVRDRARLRDMEKLLNKLLHEKLRRNADDFFEKAGLDAYAELKVGIPIAKEIWLLGLSNLKTITNYYTEIKQALQTGAGLQVLMLNPNPQSPALLMQGMRTLNPRKEISSQHAREAVGLLEQLSKECSAPGKLEIKALDYLPGYGLLAVDPTKRHGKMKVKMYPFKQAKSEYPVFHLSAELDEHWYDFFAAQFQLLWNVAEPVSLSGESSASKSI